MTDGTRGATVRSMNRSALLRHPLAGHLAGVAGVALLVWAIDLAIDSVNALSMAVCFQLLVLLVSGAAGLGPGLTTSLVSALAFNFFFVPPTHTLTISSSRDGISLFVFIATAAVTSYLAAGFRRQRAEAEERRRDAELLGEMAATALGGIGAATADEEVARAAARALDVEWCAVLRDAGATPRDAHPVHLTPGAEGFTVPLVAADRVLGLLQVVRDGLRHRAGRTRPDRLPQTSWIWAPPRAPSSLRSCSTRW